MQPLDRDVAYAAAGRALELRIAFAIRDTARERPSFAEFERCTLRRPVSVLARCDCGCGRRRLCKSCRDQDAGSGPDWSWDD